ncbi:MAG: hypothetical protein GF317_03510 [Candidatus Lokiarchaeota archaeon]|nr:hypothetical protein [Candidatus Lokiarchaeota archaeon]MBD3198963.1 hypothetical protein [Candidatus Lokiarchaeota archaeon]
MYIVDEFWIIDFNGIPLFNFSPSEDLDSNLVASFFSAIQQFALEVSKGKGDRYIDSVKLGKFTFHFLINHEYNLYFISKSSNKVRKKMIRTHLHEIERMFINEYQDLIKNYEGEVSLFEKFKNKFEKYFEDNFTKLKGMW